MILPDIIGFTLDEAKDRIQKSAMVVERITVLSPPREKTLEFDGTYRVIRVISMGNDKLELQICKPL